MKSANVLPRETQNDETFLGSLRPIMWVRTYFAANKTDLLIHTAVCFTEYGLSVLVLLSVDSTQGWGGRYVLSAKGGILHMHLLLCVPMGVLSLRRWIGSSWPVSYLNTYMICVSRFRWNGHKSDEFDLIARRVVSAVCSLGTSLCRELEVLHGLNKHCSKLVRSSRWYIMSHTVDWPKPLLIDYRSRKRGYPCSTYRSLRINSQSPSCPDCGLHFGLVISVWAIQSSTAPFMAIHFFARR